MNATYTQKPVSFPSSRPLNCRMFWFWRHGARTYPAPTRRLLEALTDQPACVISSHSSLLKAMVAARTAPRCFSFLRERRSRRTCSSCSLGSLGSFMVSSSKAKSSRWVRAFSRLARRGFAFSGGGGAGCCSLLLAEDLLLTGMWRVASRVASRARAMAPLVRHDSYTPRTG